MSRETEFVPAKEVQEGDELTGGKGVITRRVNDSGVLTFDTTVTFVMKDQNAPMERYKRDPNGSYGYEWCMEQQRITDAGMADGLDA